MKARYTAIVAALMATAIGAQAQTTIIDTGFTSDPGDGTYLNGDLVNNAAWAAVANTGANAFDVTDTANDGFIDTAPTDGVDTNTGDFVYLTGASAGNEANDQWTSVVDFELSLSTASGFDDAAGDIWRLGLSTVINTNLSSSVDSTNQLFVRVASFDDGRVGFRSNNGSGENGLFMNIDAADVGWNGTNDITTDKLRLTWDVRKTRNGTGELTDYYTMSASVSNMVTHTNFYGNEVTLTKPELYAFATPYILMGQVEAATYSNDTEVVDIKIDNLSIIKESGVTVPLAAPNVSAESGNQFVNLSWDYVLEATSYDVKLITAGVTNVLSGGSAITTNGYEHLGLVNGTEYTYIVTANGAGVPSVDSAPVLGEPNTAVTGPIFDTTFDSSDYADGNIVGQNSWIAHAAQADDAFNVDSSGSGFAETATFTGSFNTNVGNAIIYNKIMSNGVNAAWSGTTVFSLNVEPEPGLYVTNSDDVVENIQQVADLGNNHIFSFGVTDDKELDLLASNGGGDALVAVRTQGNGAVQVGFNMNSFNDPGISLQRGDVGWDPEWRDDSSNGAPSFVTEPITVNWKIRKLSVTNAYVLTVDVAVSSNTWDIIPQYIYPGSLQGGDSEPDNVWPADVVYFGIVHDAQALEEGLGAVNPVNVSIDSLSLTHTNNGFEAFAPIELGAANGNLELDLTWEGAVDADSFSIWRSDGTNPDVGPYTEITNITFAAPPFSYTDDDEGAKLTDKRTYFYKFVANYPGSVDSEDSEILIARALGTVEVTELRWGPSKNIVGSDIGFTRTPDAVVGNVIFSEGNGTDNALMHSTQANYSEAPSLYGVLQMSVGASFDGKTGIDSFANPSDRIVQGATALATNTAVVYMKPAAPLDMANNVYSAAYARSLSGTQMRFAIRNAGTWYISQTDFDGAQNALVNLTDMGNANWAEIEIATSSTTTMMADPLDLTYAPVAGLTAVDAVGYYVWDVSGKSAVIEMSVTTGSAANDFDKWADTVSLYNENAVRTTDPDNDGYNNASEWGLGGDPLDVNDQGYTEMVTSLENGGDTNYFVVRHAMVKEPSPDHNLTETDNLQYTGFTDVTNAVVNTLVQWEGDDRFYTVVNRIPTTNTTVKFVQLNIE